MTAREDQPRPTTPAKTVGEFLRHDSDTCPCKTCVQFRADYPPREEGAQSPQDAQCAKTMAPVAGGGFIFCDLPKGHEGLCSRTFPFQMTNGPVSGHGPLCDNCGRSSRQHYCWRGDDYKSEVSTYHPSELRARSTPSPDQKGNQDGQNGQDRCASDKSVSAAAAGVVRVRHVDAEVRPVVPPQIVSAPPPCSKCGSPGVWGASSSNSTPTDLIGITRAALDQLCNEKQAAESKVAALESEARVGRAAAKCLLVSDEARAKAEAQVRELRSERDGLREALRKYGNHRIVCTVHMWMGSTGGPVCNCGWEKAVATLKVEARLSGTEKGTK